MASALHQQELAPGGCTHAVFLNLHYHSAAPSRHQSSFLHRGRLRTQLVTARDDLLTIYDVYDRSSSQSAASTSNGTANGTTVDAKPRHTLVVARQHSLFGTVTGLQRVDTLASDKDARHRLLVSFADAKLALLEWNDTTDDLETVSIHTYERATQLLNGTPPLFRPNLNVDPLSRCAALLLPHDALAILPFYRDNAEFDFDDGLGLDLANDALDASDAAAMAAAAHMESLPYSPSFVLTMREVDPKIRNLKDFCFLPGFQKPTVAVLFDHSPTWTGLLTHRKDSFAVYLFTLDLSASLDGATLGSAAALLDDGNMRSAHPVVTTSSQLPYDCLYMLPCPQSLGGVLVVCMSAILHVDQSGRVVVTALNRWFKTTSAIEPESVLDVPGLADLQASQLVFTTDTDAVLSLSNGDLYRLRCHMDGRSVEGFRLERIDQLTAGSDEMRAATGPPPSCLAIPSYAADQASAAKPDMLFAASMAGDAALYDLVPVKVAVEQVEQDAKAGADANDMDLDLDDDLYGSSAADTGRANGASREKTVMALRRADEVRSHGTLHSIARRKLAEPEPRSSKRHTLVGTCGAGNQAGLVYLDPRFVPHRRTELRLGDKTHDEPESHAKYSRIFTVGTDASGSVLLIASDSDSDRSIGFASTASVGHGDGGAQATGVVDLQGATMNAGELVGGDAIARITPTSLQVLSSSSWDVLHETAVSGAHVLSASLDAQQYAVLHTADGDTLIYRYDAQQRFERLDLSTVQERSSIVAANVFRDTYGQLALVRGTKALNGETKVAAPTTRALALQDDEEVDYDDDVPEPATATTQPRDESAEAPAYLFALDSEGVTRILTLPGLELVWKNASLAAQPQRLRYEERGHAELAAEQVASLSSVRVCHVGDMLSIVSLTADHFLSVYRSNAWASPDEVARVQSQLDGSHGSAALGLTFNKVHVQVLAVPAGARSFEANRDGFRAGPVQLEPIAIASARHEETHEPNALIVLGGGREAQASVLCWTHQGGYRLLDWDDGSLAWAASIPRAPSTGTEAAEFAYCDRAGAVWLACSPEGLYSTTAWMSSVVRTGREYTRVVAHDPTHTVIAASVQPCRFVLFDDDGEPVPTGNETDVANEDAHPSQGLRGSLELFIDEDRTTAADGFEFEANEIVTALELVSLDASSSPTGRRQFIAAGTSTFHGEDRTSKGSVYLFEVIEVVSGKYQLGRDLRLKLVCRDDARAPVTAIAELNGFLLSTCGQKLYVRALEKEEWLISVAFLDGPFYMTSLRVLKNFVLVSDAKKSLCLLAFQEEPYRFVDLGREINDHNASMAQFLVYNDRLSLVSTSDVPLGGISGFGASAGVIRLYEYAPHVATTLGGHRLLLRSEFQTPAAAVGSTVCRGRWLSDSELRGREEGRSKLVLAKANGALDSLSALDDKVAKRLHLLQGQLVRSVQHTAALNPRAFRAVRNDFVPRSLAKGILDARLLDRFVWLSRPKMLEAVRTLSGLFDGLDQIKKRKRDSNHEAEQDQSDDDLQHIEQLRLQSEHKRVQLILKDLLRLRLGFDQV